MDLTSFHKFSEDRLIVPILIATKHEGYSTTIQKSVYDKNVLNPLIAGESGLQELIEKILKEYPNFQEIRDDWIISHTRRLRQLLKLPERYMKVTL